MSENAAMCYALLLSCDVGGVGAVGAFATSFGCSLSVLKKSAKPVSIGNDGAMAKGLGFLRSIIAVATVWMVRFPADEVWQRATELKYLGMIGPNAEPTEVG